MSCKFCMKPFGKEFKVNRSVNKFEQPDAAFLHLLEGDEPGIVLLKRNNGCGWFDIKYCPFCGEKLRSEENE
ncbi:hypothetical protein QYB28_002953 [Clostridium perfringens]|uniref:DUF6980 family protein n=1 Tax=Clostridium perfringens TaxID=1502 RepID=UPI001ABA5615|nr:hypothetical protein [Clostridium perfringens]MBO3393936.1 hypothetical protein [Clostridium perfringens]MBO3399999.1 hypothetical protein [Clostridium perfringens]MDU4052302.1 hypothetical protein [Clostridium perfringens]UBK39481.1 hypothetical protein KLF44_16190 [Clostridium perfringens]